MRILNLISAALVAGFFLSGCGDQPEPTSDTSKDKTAASKPKAAPAPRTFWSQVKLHEAIRAKNPDYTGNGQFEITDQGEVVNMILGDCNVTDLSILEGMNLKGLDLQGCGVTDISALEGMGLTHLFLEKTLIKDIAALAGNTTMQELYLSNTVVTDLSPLKGMPLTKLNLTQTFIKDLSPLAGMPIQMLWLTDAPVEDISPLRSCPLVSLTLHRTKVSDLSPLAGTRLERLHIGECPVTDVSPLAGMNLTRLVFDKDKVEKGLDAIMMMRSLKEIGSKFDDGEKNLAHPAVFWGAAPGGQ